MTFRGMVLKVHFRAEPPERDENKIRNALNLLECGSEYAVWHSSGQRAYVITTDESAGHFLRRMRPILDSIFGVENYWAFAPADVAAKNSNSDPFVHAWQNAMHLGNEWNKDGSDGLAIGEMPKFNAVGKHPTSRTREVVIALKNKRRNGAQSSAVILVPRTNASSSKKSIRSHTIEDD